MNQLQRESRLANLHKLQMEQLVKQGKAIKQRCKVCNIPFYSKEPREFCILHTYIEDMTDNGHG